MDEQLKRVGTGALRAIERIFDLLSCFGINILLPPPIMWVTLLKINQRINRGKDERRRTATKPVRTYGRSPTIRRTAPHCGQVLLTCWSMACPTINPNIVQRAATPGSFRALLPNA